MRLRTSRSSLARPFKKVSSTRKTKADTVAPSASTSVPAAWAVPPVARTSSTTRARSPSRSASSWTSTQSVPYSRSYTWRRVPAGSFPFLRTGTKPAPSRSASTPPMMKPRLSMATTLSHGRSSQSATRRSIIRRKSAGSLSSVVMSLKTMPGLGKSGTSRMAALSGATRASRSTGAAILPDVEPGVAARRYGGTVHPGHRGEGGTAAQARLQLAQHLLGPFRHHLHAPVGEVPREPGHAQPLGLAQDEVAVAHALHAAGDDVAVGGHGAPLYDGTTSRRSAACENRSVEKIDLRWTCDNCHEECVTVAWRAEEAPDLEPVEARARCPICGNVQEL